jgi:natural product precursor
MENKFNVIVSDEQLSSLDMDQVRGGYREASAAQCVGHCSGSSCNGQSKEDTTKRLTIC